MSDENDKVKRLSFDELERLDTGEVMLRANDALVLNELRNVLKRQAERDIVIEDMRSVIDKLSELQGVAVNEIMQLRRGHSVLLRQQVELYERQEILANVCDAYVQRLSEVTDKHERLAAEIDDKD